MSLTKGNLLMLGAWIAVAVLIGTLLAANIQPLLIAINGKLSLGDDIGYFKISWTRQLWIALLALTMVAAPIFLQRSLTRLESDFDTSKQEAIEAKAALDEFGERMHDAVKSSFETYDRIICDLGTRLRFGQSKCETNHKINEISRRLADVERVSLSSGEIAVYGTGTDRIGSLQTSTREIYVFDPKTADETLVVIVHIFDGVAFWEYGENNLFVELDDETDVNLWRHLKSPEAVDKLGEFDLVAGLGLESNTGDAHPNISRLRAGALCTGLNGMFANRTHTQAVGLDIGMYRGSARESKTDRDPQLRPVILVGINAKKHADYNLFLQELLAKVKIPQLELRRFENLREGRKPAWVYPPDCKPDFEFVGSD